LTGPVWNWIIVQKKGAVRWKRYYFIAGLLIPKGQYLSPLKHIIFRGSDKISSSKKRRI